MRHPVLRRFVAVAGRRVHYRRCGSGPPLVLLHGSPADSEVLAGEVAAASEHFTCYALDTPGFGHSDPLPGQSLSVRDLAAATGEALRALGLPPCRVYGTHSGAAIALELGVGWPGQVSSLVLEGLPAFNAAEIEVLFSGHFAPMEPDPLGGHFTSTWMRFRDQFTWFPWRSRDVTRLNPVDRPAPEDVDLWVSMFYRSCQTYEPAYRAVCTWGDAALRAVRALQRPAVFMASAEDMLYPHLDRLPPLKPGQRVVRLPHDPATKHASLVRLLLEAEGTAAATAAPDSVQGPAVGQDPALQFIDAPEGQVLVRVYGVATLPPLLLLHDAPGSGAAHEALARALACSHRVFLPDLPGNGESPAPSSDMPILEAGAEAVRAVVAHFGLPSCALAALGCGGAIAALLAQRRGSDAWRPSAIVLDALGAADDDRAARIAPPIELSAEGAHWLRSWLMLRDGQIYAPWYDGRVAAQRLTQGNFDAQWLHEQTCALMRARSSYHLLPQAAARMDVSAAFTRSAAPWRVAAPEHFAAALAALADTTENTSPA